MLRHDSIVVEFNLEYSKAQKLGILKTSQKPKALFEMSIITITKFICRLCDKLFFSLK